MANIDDIRWASEGGLTSEVFERLKDSGYTTMDGTLATTPEYPLLQVENEWKNKVYEIISDLLDTDASIEDILEEVDTRISQLDLQVNPPTTSGSFDVGRAEEFEPKPPTLLVTGERRPNPITRIGVDISTYFDGTHRLCFAWDTHGANNLTDFPMTYSSGNTDVYCWRSGLSVGHNIMMSYLHHVNHVGLTMKMVCGNGHTWELKPIEDVMKVMDVTDIRQFSTTSSTPAGITEGMAKYTENNFWWGTGNLSSAGGTYQQYWSNRFYDARTFFIPIWDWAGNRFDEEGRFYNQYNIYKDGQPVNHFVGFGDLDLGNFETLNPEGIRFIAENATMKDGVVTTSRGVKIDTKKGLQRVWFRCENLQKFNYRDYNVVYDRVYDLNIPIKGGKRYEIEAISNHVPRNQYREAGHLAIRTRGFASWSCMRSNYSYMSGTGIHDQIRGAGMNMWYFGQPNSHWTLRGTKCVLPAIPEELIGEVVPDTINPSLSPVTDPNGHLYNSITMYTGTEIGGGSSYGTGYGVLKITELDD